MSTAEEEPSSQDPVLARPVDKSELYSTWVDIAATATEIGIMALRLANPIPGVEQPEQPRGPQADAPEETPDPLASLTKREREALKAVSTGSSNAQIANQWSVKVETVKSLLTHAYKKLGVENRTEAAVFYISRNVNGHEQEELPEAVKYIDKLTSREKEVAHLVAQGLSSCQVAEQLLIKESTVKFHLTNIYKKLGVKNRTELAYVLQLWREGQEADTESGKPEEVKAARLRETALASAGLLLKAGSGLIEQVREM